MPIVSLTSQNRSCISKLISEWNLYDLISVKSQFDGWGYTHDRRADKNPYPHDRRADKESYPHDRNVTDNLCSLIKLCFAFIMVNFST